MEYSLLSVCLPILVALICLTQGEEALQSSDSSAHQLQKRTALVRDDLTEERQKRSPMLGDDLPDEDLLDSPYAKRGTLFRFGKRGGLFRFGKRQGSLLRYGKRGGTLFRFGRSGPGTGGEDPWLGAKRLLSEEDLLRSAIARDAFENGPALYKRGDAGFHWGRETDE